MRSYSILFIGALVVIFSATVLRGQAEQPSTYRMELPISGGAGSVQMVNAKKLEQTEWPATLKYLVKSAFNCTSTIVGSKVLITAAHCMVEKGSPQVQIDGSSFNLTCDTHPRFQPSKFYSYDITLCLSDKPFPSNFKYENLDLRITHVRSSSSIFLVGYGCRQFPKDGAPPPVNGDLYGGFSTVQAVSEQSGDHFVTQGGTVICPGDSGGASYLLIDHDSLTSGRSIVGVNSLYDDTTQQSFITALTDDVATFIQDWAADHGASICGVDSNAANCRPQYAP
jgi:Trypsin